MWRKNRSKPVAVSREGVKRKNQDRKRFKARAARRPVRFWWQAFALLGLSTMLWWQLPVDAVLFEPRRLAPPPNRAPRMSYWHRKSRAGTGQYACSSTPPGGVAADIELGVFDVIEEQRPPVFLEQGARYPGVRNPPQSNRWHRRYQQSMRLLPKTLQCPLPESYRRGGGRKRSLR